MVSVRCVLAALGLGLAGTVAMPALAQNLFMPAPFPEIPDTVNHEFPGVDSMPAGQPLLHAPLPRPRPRIPLDTTATALATPALASARASVAEPATTGRGQVASPPASAGGQVRIVNNTALAVATMSLIPAKAPSGAQALITNLGPFTVTNAALPAARGCVFAVQGTFADGSPLAIDTIDLCRDPLINITVW
jgi:hypothetical protein